jgi:hypothetical protein
MRLARLLSATTFLIFLSARSAAAQTGVSAGEMEILNWFEYGGMLAIGWGAGVTSWLVTGHQAMSCLFVNMPWAWKLLRKNVLTSSLPIFKYLFGGGLLLVLGAILVDQVWGIWTQAFDVGLLAGIVVGAGHSFLNMRRVGNRVDFLDANQRYLNEDQVPFFTDSSER